MSRVHVVQITQDLLVGGLPRVIETLCHTIDRDRFQMSIVCIRQKGQMGEQLEREGFPVHVIRAQPFKTDHLGFLPMRRMLRQIGADVVHTHNTEAFIDGAIGARLAGVRTVIHTDHAREFPDAFRYMAAEHVVSHLAYRVVGVSAHTTENLRRYEKISQRKLRTIINGVDPAPFTMPVDAAAKRRELGIPADAPLLGLGARLEPQKAIEHLIGAMQLLRRDLPAAHLLIAGEGSLEKDLRRRTEELDQSANVHFLGVRPDMREILRALDIMVLPSDWEGLPMIVLEAMAAGCPVVASNVGGIPTAITDGESGALVTARDTPGLASALLALLKDPQRRARYAAAARERFHRDFSATAMTRQYEALYLRQDS